MVGGGVRSFLFFGGNLRVLLGVDIFSLPSPDQQTNSQTGADSRRVRSTLLGVAVPAIGRAGPQTNRRLNTGKGNTVVARSVASAGSVLVSGNHKHQQTKTSIRKKTLSLRN